MKHESRKENLQLKKLTREELKELPTTKVIVTYNRKDPKSDIIATIFLDSFQKVEFLLSEQDIILLQQEHKLTNFGKKEEFEKQYHLMKGFHYKGTKKQFEWMRVDLLIVPNIVVHKFLDKKTKYYVRTNKKLYDLFQNYI